MCVWVSGWDATESKIVRSPDAGMERKSCDARMLSSKDALIVLSSRARRPNSEPEVPGQRWLRVRPPAPGYAFGRLRRAYGFARTFLAAK